MRLSKEEQARYAGAEWIMRVVRDKGIEAAEQELKKRGALGWPLGLAQADVNQFSERIKTNVLSSVLCMSCLVLHDEFDFGNGRLRRFIKRFNSEADSLEGNWCTWTDFEQVLKDECNIDLCVSGECKNEE